MKSYTLSLFILLFSTVSLAQEQNRISIDNIDFDYSEGFESVNEALWLSDGDLNNILWDSAAILSILAVDDNFERDKTKHYAAGVAIGRLASAYCDSRDFNLKLSKEKLNYLCSLGAASLAGVLKEIYDSTGRGQVDAKDAVATAAGGAFVGLKFVF